MGNFSKYTYLYPSISPVVGNRAIWLCVLDNKKFPGIFDTILSSALPHGGRRA